MRGQMHIDTPKPSWADIECSDAMRLNSKSTTTSATAIQAQMLAAALPVGLTFQSQLNQT